MGDLALAFLLGYACFLSLICASLVVLVTIVFLNLDRFLRSSKSPPNTEPPLPFSVEADWDINAPTVVEPKGVSYTTWPPSSFEDVGDPDTQVSDDNADRRHLLRARVLRSRIHG